MRGATSPRLLLELTCAQVLLPAAASDEKSLLARLERLERGAPTPVPQSPPRGPRSGSDDEDPERARVPRPAEQQAPEPARTPPRQQPPPPSQPAADSLRQSWDAILEAVKQERKVAWMLLSHASVLSLEDKVLTLRFPGDGDVKGFSLSGHDAVLKRVLNTRFGLDVTVRGVAGADGVPAARPPAAVRAAPAPPEPAPPESAPPEMTGTPDEPPDELSPDEDLPDEPSPDDRAVQEAELTGMDLIQRELGGQVIGEIED